MPHRPRKRFGQHFLIDDSIVERMAAAIAPVPGERLVEIGPGQGALTAALVKHPVDVHGIELDRDLAATLSERLGRPANLIVHSGDALRFDFSSLAAERSIRVVGNLPYNISTPLLFHLLEQSARITDMHFMLQREVVDRLCAPPGSRSRGRLTLMCGARAEVTPLFDVPPEAFQPPPRVHSAVVRIVPRTLSPETLALLQPLESVVRQAFSSKRKTLRNTLSRCIDAGRLAQLDIDPVRRAETLSLDEFMRIAKALGPDTA